MSNIKKAICGSPETLLKIGEREIPCYVLEDGTAVLSGRGMQEALNLGQSHGSKLKSFLAKKEIKPFIDNELAMDVNTPIKFIRPGRGGITANGYKATVLTRICKAVSQAKRAGKFENNPIMQVIADECEIVRDAFSDVGIIATIYEITGYETRKAYNAYQTFLEKFLLKEAAAYVQRFPIDFFELMCDLKGWPYKKGKTRYIPAMGHIINDVIYSRLAPNILEELNSLNPKIDGKRKHKQHSFLTIDVGVPALNEHLIGVMALARANSSWNKFYSQLSIVYPVYKNSQLYLFPPDVVQDLIIEEDRKGKINKQDIDAKSSKDDFDKGIDKILGYTTDED